MKHYIVSNVLELCQVHNGECKQKNLNWEGETKPGKDSTGKILHKLLQTSQNAVKCRKNCVVGRLNQENFCWMLVHREGKTNPGKPD